MSDNPYGNNIIDIVGANNDAVALAASRLMPPQYDEFVLSLTGGGVSDATRKYWVEFYEFMLELIEECHE